MSRLGDVHIYDDDDDGDDDDGRGKLFQFLVPLLYFPRIVETTGQLGGMWWIYSYWGSVFGC